MAMMDVAEEAVLARQEVEDTKALARIRKLEGN